MVFVIFIIAWFALLVIHAVAGGDVEDCSLTQALGFLAVGVVFLCAIYTMFTVNFMAGVGMIGSLAVFQVQKDKET